MWYTVTISQFNDDGTTVSRTYDLLESDLETIESYLGEPYRTILHEPLPEDHEAVVEKLKQHSVVLDDRTFGE